jgi:Fe-S cluster assembly protein SufD
MSALLEQLRAAYAQVHGKDGLSHVREAAWEKFCAIGLPQKKDAGYRHVQLRELYAASLTPALATTFEYDCAQDILPECRHSHVVFVDGHFAPHLSDVQVQLLSLPAALQTWRHFLQMRFKKCIEEERDPFALLNIALHPEGAFLYLPPKHTAVVQCLFIETKQTPLCAARLHGVVGKQSSLQLITTHKILEGTATQCSMNSLDLFLEEGSQVESIAHIASTDWCFATMRSELKRQATVHSLSLLDGSKATRHDIGVQCNGEGASATLKGLWMLKGSERAHVHSLVEHNAPHTQSRQLFKGILRDASQSSFNGKICVRPIAQKTESYQLSKHLLLGNAAVAHTEPNLEIEADDVKASHGATIARPDEAQLFYLKSRGVDDEEAKQLLVHGFYQEILSEVPYREVKERFL